MGAADPHQKCILTLPGGTRTMSAAAALAGSLIVIPTFIENKSLEDSEYQVNQLERKGKV